jgi:arabinose-5-phosphate isomerase
VASIAEVMTLGPQTIFADRMAVEAVEVMDRTKTNQLLVVNRQGVLGGALNMHELFRAKVV